MLLKWEYWRFDNGTWTKEYVPESGIPIEPIFNFLIITGILLLIVGYLKFCNYMSQK